MIMMTPLYKALMAITDYREIPVCVRIKVIAYFTVRINPDLDSILARNDKDDPVKCETDTLIE